VTSNDEARLDELLHYDEEAAGGVRREATGVWLAKLVLLAVVLAGLLVMFARLIGVGLPFGLTLSGILALLLLRRVVAQVPAVPPPRPRLRVPEAVSNPPRDGLAVAASRWNTRLNWTQSDPEAFSRNIRPAIADLADERLRQRHGITRTSEPARARELLGDPLWTFLTAPVNRSPTPQQLAALIAQLEAL